MNISRLTVYLLFMFPGADVLFAQNSTYTFDFINESSQNVHLIADNRDDPAIYYIVQPDQTVTVSSQRDYIRYFAANRDYTILWAGSNLLRERYSDTKGWHVRNNELLTSSFPVMYNGRRLTEPEIKRGTPGPGYYTFSGLFVSDNPRIFRDDGPDVLRGRELFPVLHYDFEPYDYRNFPWGASMETISRIEEHWKTKRMARRREEAEGKGGELVYVETFEIEAYISVFLGMFPPESPPEEPGTESVQRSIYYYFLEGKLSMVAWVEAYPEMSANAKHRFNALTGRDYYLEKAHITRLTKLPSDTYQIKEGDTRDVAEHRRAPIRFVFKKNENSLTFWLVAPGAGMWDVIRKYEEDVRNQQ